MNAFPTEREAPYRAAELRFKAQVFPNEREGRVWADVLKHLRAAAIQAEMATTDVGEYNHLMGEASLLLEGIARALGWNGTDGQRPFSLDSLWIHASERELLGWERCRVETNTLMAAYVRYRRKNEWQTAYLEWVFLDAMMYAVLYELIDNIHDDLLKPGDTGNWLPHVQRAFAKSSDREKAHPLWLDIKLTVTLRFFRWLPTLLLLALGIGCFFAGWLPYWFNHGRDASDIGEGWPTMGWTILGLLAARRIYRGIRWLARFGLRRRAWKMITMLTDGYTLLVARAVPTRELRHALEKARDVFGRSAMFGGSFWAVVDDVCARYPVTLIPNLGVD